MSAASIARLQANDSERRTRVNQHALILSRAGQIKGLHPFVILSRLRMSGTVVLEVHIWDGVVERLLVRSGHVPTPLFHPSHNARVGLLR